MKPHHKTRLHSIPATSALALSTSIAVASALSLGAMTCTVGAADLNNIDKPAPSALWTGFYAGIHGGYADGAWDGTLASTDADGGNNFVASAGFEDPTQSIDGDGWFGGGQIGYNWQRGQLVVGLEGDLSWTDFSGSDTFRTSPEFDPGDIYTKAHEFDLDYFGTARIRGGFVTGAWLFYATGGLAWAESSGRMELTIEDEAGNLKPDTGDPRAWGTAENTHVGWTAGLGTEVKASSHWSIKAEWLYVDLGEEDYLFEGEIFDGRAFDTDAFADTDLDFHTFRVGLNYKLQ